MFQAFQRLEAAYTAMIESSFATSIHLSVWLFALTEAAHLLALAVVGCAVLVVDLRILGVGLTRQPVAHVAREMRPWPPGASPGSNTVQTPRVPPGTGMGKSQTLTPYPSSRVGCAGPTHSVISRTLSHLKSTSVALSQRKVAMGPPQVMGMASTAPPQLVESPPIWP